MIFYILRSREKCVIEYNVFLFSHSTLRILGKLVFVYVNCTSFIHYLSLTSPTLPGPYRATTFRKREL